MPGALNTPEVLVGEGSLFTQPADSRLECPLHDHLFENCRNQRREE